VKNIPKISLRVVVFKKIQEEIICQFLCEKGLQLEMKRDFTLHLYVFEIHLGVEGGPSHTKIRK
jgi:hypothetical protein